MIVSALALVLAFSQAPQPAVAAAVPYVMAILNENAGDDVVVRFVLSGPPTSYSASREGDEILVRIAAEPLPGLSLPVARDPVRSLILGSDSGFSVRVTLRRIALTRLCETRRRFGWS